MKKFLQYTTTNEIDDKVKDILEEKLQTWLIYKGYNVKISSFSYKNLYTINVDYINDDRVEEIKEKVEAFLDMFIIDYTLEEK